MKTLVGFTAVTAVPFFTSRNGHDADQLDVVEGASTPRHCLYKTELIKPQRPWKTLSQVELATAEWVDWYNHRRLHGETGHVPPAEYEANHYMESTKPQVTTTI